MLLKSFTSVEVKESDAFPIEVKEIVKSSISFFVVSSSKVIQCDQLNIEDYKNALDEFNKLKAEHPNEPFFLMGMNPNAPNALICSNIPTYRLPPTQRPRTFAIEALNQLKAEKLIDNDTSENTWLYIFGYDVPDTQSKIKWLGTIENLRLFLALWYKEELKHKAFTFKSIHNHVPFCFEKKGKPMHLSKPRAENTGRTDFIENIFRPEKG